MTQIKWLPLNPVKEFAFEVLGISLDSLQQELLYKVQMGEIQTHHLTIGHFNRTTVSQAMNVCGSLGFGSGGCIVRDLSKNEI